MHFLAVLCSAFNSWVRRAFAIFWSFLRLASHLGVKHKLRHVKVEATPFLDKNIGNPVHEYRFYQIRWQPCKCNKSGISISLFHLVHFVLPMAVVGEQKTLSKKGKACSQELDIFWNLNLKSGVSENLYDILITIWWKWSEMLRVTKNRSVLKRNDGITML